MSEMEAWDGLYRAVSAACNYHSFDARCGMSDSDMAYAIVDTESAASVPGGVLAWLAAHDAKVRAEGAAEALRDAAEAVLSGEHRWQGGYFCECGHEVNSAAGWFAHVATARADAIQEGRADG